MIWEFSRDVLMTEKKVFFFDFDENVGKCEIYLCLSRNGLPNRENLLMCEHLSGILDLAVPGFEIPHLAEKNKHNLCLSKHNGLATYFASRIFALVREEGFLFTEHQNF